MRGWILFKKSEQELGEETYEINRFLEESRKTNIHLKVVRPDQIDLVVTTEGRDHIYLNGESTPLPDFLLPRMGAGTTYFALAVIRQLEHLGVYSVNSAEAVDYVKDKLHSLQILAEKNFPVPKSMLAKFPVDYRIIEKHLGFPVVVKTLCGSLGKGIFLCQNRFQFEDLMQLVESANPSANIVLQEFIADSCGRDLRVIVIGGKAVACMERTAQPGSFKANFSSGGSARHYELNPEITQLAVEATKVLNLDISGVDLLFSGNHFKICEVNSAPGFKGMELCTDINLPQQIFKFIKKRLKTRQFKTGN
ncbi:MAG: RimK family alpha-L-glutamate ligase [Candidatus Cloacimonetes bacterium]|nr:RimK family alpha-L-glutamate ligase [Candidatus Cloacimonadota bacterium]